MAVEIERRFLLKNSTEWRDVASGPRRITQFYLGHGPVVRVRVYSQFGKPDFSAVMTIKGARQPGQLGKTEIEFRIPEQQAKELVMAGIAIGETIIKDRYIVMHDGMLWELDVFDGLNRGLMIAEVELEREDQAITLPSWVGEEITDDHRYSNSSLALHPLKDWNLDKDDYQI